MSGQLPTFFSYFGAKHRITKKYPPPGRDKIIEPFAGAAGYSHRYPHHKVELYDVDPKVYGVWDYLIHVPESEFVRLPVVFDTTEDLPIPLEAKWFLGWRISKAQVTPAVRPTGWFKSNDVTHKGTFWSDSIKLQLTGQLRHIRHWKVHHKSYAEVPDEDAFWFIDPPYQAAGQYVYRDVDYSHLAEWCRSRTGRVVVCENRGANWLPFRDFSRLQANSKKFTVEVVWTNF